MQLLFCPDNYIDGDEFVKLSDTELHSLVKPLGPYKKIRRLIPDLASADTSTSLGSTKAEQTLNSESKRSLSLVSQLKHVCPKNGFLFVSSFNRQQEPENV